MKYRHSAVLTTLATALLATVLTPAALRASPVTLINPSFENTILGDGASSTSIPGWTIVTGNTTVPITGIPLTDAVTTYNPTASNYAGAAGNNSAPGMSGANVLSLSGGLVGLTGLVTQTTTVPLTAGTTYTFTVAVGNPADDFFHGYTVSLTAGATVLNFVTGNNIPDGTFQDVTLTYTPNVLDPIVADLIARGQQLTVSLASNSLATVGASSVSFDNARLDATITAVPEPSTVQAVVAGLAMLGFVGYIRRRNTVHA